MQHKTGLKNVKTKAKSVEASKGNGCPPGMVKDKDGNCVKEVGP